MIELFADSPLINLPISDNEIANMTQLYPNHTGLAASKISSGSGRSARHAYILVIGLTKSGKSSTVIHSGHYPSDILFQLF